MSVSGSKSLRSNIFFSVLVQMTSSLTALVTSPYIARVLNANIIGDYGYVVANSSYFVLLEDMGLPLYATLCVAAIRDDIYARSKLFWEILCLRLVLMTASVAAYSGLFLVYNRSNLYLLYMIMILSIIGKGTDISWFLTGLEEFRIIAIRTVIIRLLTVTSVFLFVRREEDLYIYAAIMQCEILISSLSVFPVAIKRLHWVRPRILSSFAHLKKSITFFVPGIVNVIFTSADKSVLGAFTSNSYEVGVYEQSNKICQVCSSVINAVSNAFLPRATYLYHNKSDKDTSIKYSLYAIRIAFFCSIPLTLGMASVSEDLIPWFFGKGYEKSIIILQILAYNILFTAVANFMSQQCLISRGKQRQYNIAVITGSVVNVILNVLLADKYMSIGVASSSVFSGMVVFAIVLLQSKEVVSVKDIIECSWKYILSGLIMMLCIYCIPIGFTGFLRIAVTTLIGAVIYMVSLFVLRDDIIMGFIRRFIFRSRKLFIGKQYYTVIRMDGGISSQMLQYMIGAALTEQGRHVLYDISWFDEGGKDLNGNDNRRFDLLKLFPNLKFEQIDSKTCKKYKKFCHFMPSNEEAKLSMAHNRLPEEPVYAAGYYFPEQDVYREYGHMFKISPESIAGFGQENLDMARDIMSNINSVGVHVRRGDMADKVGYWTNVTEDYFINAIKLYDPQEYKYYFFSEDLDWVRENIISEVGDINYELVDINDSVHGYCDLALLSLCRIQIISQGSFGGTAHLINNNQDKEMVIPDIPEGFRNHPNSEKWEDTTEALVRKVKVG